MKVRWRVVARFAIAGGMIPLLLTALGANIEFFLAVCPSSIFFLALDGRPSFLWTVYVLACVCVANILLYSFLGLLVAILIPTFQSKPRQNMPHI
jgi:hypothetical protein